MNNGDKYYTNSCFCKLISIVHCKTEIVGRLEFITDLDHLNMSEEVVEVGFQLLDENRF